MTTMGNLPEVVSREEWLAARKDLLTKEKELTRARDRLNADRRRLPMVRIDKPYTFEGPDGTVSLLDLFDGRPQLVMHHFMFGRTGTRDARAAHRPPTGSAGCGSCTCATPRSSRCHGRPTPSSPRSGSGWAGQFPWYSSYGSDFNYDFHATLDDRVAPVLLHFRTEAELAEAGTPWTGGPWTEDMNDSELPGISAFLQVDGEVFHTYSTYGRGIEEFHNGYHYLDLTALGRQEEWEEPAGRAEPLGLQVGGPAMRLPDEYDV